MSQSLVLARRRPRRVAVSAHPPDPPTGHARARRHAWEKSTGVPAGARQHVQGSGQRPHLCSGESGTLVQRYRQLGCQPLRPCSAKAATNSPRNMFTSRPNALALTCSTSRDGRCTQPPDPERVTGSSIGTLGRPHHRSHGWRVLSRRRRRRVTPGDRRVGRPPPLTTPADMSGPD